VLQFELRFVKVQKALREERVIVEKAWNSRFLLTIGA